MNYRAVSGVVSRSDCDRIANRLDISTSLSRNDIYKFSIKIKTCGQTAYIRMIFKLSVNRIKTSLRRIDWYNYYNSGILSLDSILFSTPRFHPVPLQRRGNDYQKMTLTWREMVTWKPCEESKITRSRLVLRLPDNSLFNQEVVFP